MSRRYQISFAAPPHPDAVAFLESQTRVAFQHLDMRDWFCATAWNDDDQVVGVLIAEPRNWFDWHFSCAITDQRFMSKRLLRAIFKTLFARAVRVTALIEPSNERAILQAVRMGFVYEGFMRLGLEGTRDVYLFGMLPADCRFLPGYQGAGTIIRTDIAGAQNGQLAQAS